MAKLDLGEYQLELELMDPCGVPDSYDYYLTITSRGVNLLAPWLEQALGERGLLVGGSLRYTTFVPLDEHFRPLLTGEHPIQLTDNDGGGYMKVTGYPSAYLAAEGQSPWTVSWKAEYGDAIRQLRERVEKLQDQLGLDKEPKSIHLEPEDWSGQFRFNFQFTQSAMCIPVVASRPTDGWGNLAFDAYVRHEALERFLSELEAERKAFKGQDETEE